MKSRNIGLSDSDVSDDLHMYMLTSEIHFKASWLKLTDRRKQSEGSDLYLYLINVDKSL